MKILAIQGSNLKKVKIKTDTTILLAAEAQKRGYKIYYFEPEDLSFLNGKSCSFMQTY
jgi:glutathione synthase